MTPTPSTSRLREFLRPLYVRIQLAVGRCVLKVVDDSKLLQEVQLRALAGETLGGVEHFQHYGFTSVPFPGCEGVIVCAGGSRDHALLIATGDRRYRLTGLAEGEVALHDDQGQFVHLKRDSIDVKANTVVNIEGTAEINLTAVLVTVTGDLAVTGSITADGDIQDLFASGPSDTMEASRDIFNDHVHPENGGNGPTDPPTTSQGI